MVAAMAAMILAVVLGVGRIVGDALFHGCTELSSQLSAESQCVQPAPDAPAAGVGGDKVGDTPVAPAGSLGGSAGDSQPTAAPNDLSSSGSM